MQTILKKSQSRLHVIFDIKTCKFTLSHIPDRTARWFEITTSRFPPLAGIPISILVHDGIKKGVGTNRNIPIFKENVFFTN